MQINTSVTILSVIIVADHLLMAKEHYLANFT